MMIQMLLFSIVSEILSLPNPYRGGLGEINNRLKGAEVCEIKNSARVVEATKVGGRGISYHNNKACTVMSANDIKRIYQHSALPFFTVEKGNFLPIVIRVIKEPGHMIEHPWGRPFPFKDVRTYRESVCGRLSQVGALGMDANTNIAVGECKVSGGNLDLNPRPDLVLKGSLSNLVSLLSGVEGSPDQRHTNGAQAHPYDRSSPHDERPQGGLLLRNKVLLITLICAVFAGLLCRAFIKLSDGDDAAGLPYLLLGVFGVMASLIVGPALIFGGF